MVEQTPTQIFVFDGKKIDHNFRFTVDRNGQTTSTESGYSKIISLDHDGTRLTGSSSSAQSW
jgi:hypothetical protein